MLHNTIKETFQILIMSQSHLC